MAIISSAKITDSKTNWEINITDRIGPGTRFHLNNNKLNHTKSNNICQFVGCSNKIRINRTSGRCDTHLEHKHSLFLELYESKLGSIKAPLHIEIVDKLVEWAKLRNYNLTPLFQDLSFNILGNIPDVSTLSSDTIHAGFHLPKLQDLVNEIILLVDKHLPDFNNSSYQPLKTREGAIPARILALVFAGLVLCEEANRGDRWFCRVILKDESRTELLGGAMPIAYFAASMFPWGIEIGKAAYRFVPNG